MSFNQARKIAQAIAQFDAIVPVMVNDMGQIALNHFTKSFRDQGFTDQHLETWKPRKRLRQRDSDSGRGILIGKGTGNLRKLRKQNIGKYKTRILANEAARKYARVHNEGLRAGRGSGFQMPKREFVGFSSVMNRKIKQKINSKIHSIFK